MSGYIDKNYVHTKGYSSIFGGLKWGVKNNRSSTYNLFFLPLNNFLNVDWVFPFFSYSSSQFCSVWLCLQDGGEEGGWDKYACRAVNSSKNSLTTKNVYHGRRNIFTKAWKMNTKKFFKGTAWSTPDKKSLRTSAWMAYSLLACIHLLHSRLECSIIGRLKGEIYFTKIKSFPFPLEPMDSLAKSQN